MIPIQTVVDAIPECVTCEFGDGIAVFDTRSNKYFSLNAVGQFVWTQLAEPVRLSEVISRVCERFDVEAFRCEADVQALIRDLAEHRLVRLH